MTPVKAVNKKAITTKHENCVRNQMYLVKRITVTCKVKMEKKNQKLVQTIKNTVL